MRLNLVNVVPARYEQSLLQRIVQSIQNQLNNLTEGRMAARHFTATSIPTTGDFAQGDIIWDAAPVEAGSAASKYVRLGWICVAGGSPGTLLEMRVLTGN